MQTSSSIYFNALSETRIVTSAITGIHHIFTYLLNEQSIRIPKKIEGRVEIANDKFNRWLHERYEETQGKLLSLLKHEEQPVQELALCSIVKLMQSEIRHPLKKNSSTYQFPDYRLEPLMTALVSDSEDNHHLITLLFEYMECQDFMFFTLLALSNIVNVQKDKGISETFMKNLFLLLEHIDIPEKDTVPLDHPKLLVDQNSDKTSADSEKPKTFKIPYKKAKKAINTIWPVVLKYPLTPNLYRRCLILIPEKVMQHLDEPLRLTDFFMESYNLGGAISLLALQGVFILVNKHDLEYPNFFTKLYALMEPTIFHAKYKPRFFMLCDRFLSSSHIPEYLVAAFVKRLARLSLVAPSSSLVLIIKFIINLLIRYPGLKKLINNPNAQPFEIDPYDAEEPEPAKCKASESSLWEIVTLQQHALPYVSKAAGFLKKNLPSVEYDISEFVETTNEEIFERACKMNIRDKVATTFQKPHGLFKYSDDKMSQFWSVM
ncbi:nucleolar complex protein 4 homolog A isoform X2 [Panulirus ornatus]|uniref:nucleolar complex protein 4 homolog A isoform X2 n=1 Tax=Panulirus ornatus TaxID=150431 RepID=UPI003A8AC6C9